MDSTVTDWVDRADHDSSDDDLSDDEPFVTPGEGSIYDDPAALFASMGMANPNLPISVVKKPKEVREESRERSKKIGSSYKTLREIVERHEATIQRRWANKTKQQKLKVLLTAWPMMPGVHRPDFQALRKESPTQRDSGTKFKDAYMWPYINQEDLTKPRPLMLLINARARNPPPNFATADFEAMHLGLVSKAIVSTFLHEYTMILNGVTEAKNYGNLVSWEADDDAFDWMHSRKQFPPGEGLLVLESQERLLVFLVSCCRLILHEIPEDSLTSDAYPPQPEPQLKPETEEGSFDSLAIMAASAPYRLPAKLDLKRIESLLAARTAAAEDHLWALREDPGYFAQDVLDYREHRQEVMLDTRNAKHPIFRLGREGLLWGRVVSNVLVEALITLELFSELHRLSKGLLSLSAKYRDVISPGEDLPEEYLYALLEFRYTLEQASKGPLGQLKHTAVASPPMRGLFVRVPPPEDELNKIRVEPRSAKMNSIESQVIWLLRILWEDDYELFLARLPAVVDELERLSQSEREARQLLSPRIASTIGDLSIISQCMTQLELFQPWAANFDQAFVEKKDEIQRDNAARREPWTRILSALDAKSLGRIVALGTPAEGRFTYPVNKRRTEANVEILRRAEANLDSFWESVDQLLFNRAGSLEGTVTRRLLEEPRILQRTPEWVEPAKVEGDKPAVDQEVLVKPFSNLFYGLSEPSQKMADVAPKIKVKTRGAPHQPEGAATETSTQEADGHDSQPVFAVDARALKVFRTFFFNPEVTSTPGTVAWGDFLHAMRSTGFGAEKLYGSAWQFKPSGLGVERGIQFHEPHPSGKLPFTVARRYGRRLSRAYGWFGGMFVLKEKSG